MITSMNLSVFVCFNVITRQLIQQTIINNKITMLFQKALKIG